MDSGVIVENKVLKDHKVHKDHKVQAVNLDLLVLEVTEENQEHPVLMDNQEHQDQVASQETEESRVPKVQQDLMANQDHLDEIRRLDIGNGDRFAWTKWTKR